MERRTILGGITAVTVSAFSSSVLKQFAQGQQDNAMAVAADFETSHIKTNENTIFIRRYGQDPALLTVHGFPRTSLVWRYVAPRLAKDYTVICVDLRGYGNSGTPASREDHYPYTPTVSHSTTLKKSNGSWYLTSY
jgi:haloacetate dehalogenase